MSEKFIKRLKKRLVLSTLTMFVILSQTAPLIASAASNNDIMDAINNDIGTEISIIIEEDAIDTTRNSNTAINPILLERAQARQEKNTSKSSKSKGTTNSNSGYSLDGREYSYKGENKTYKTAKYWSEQNPELKKALDHYFGEKNLVNTGVYSDYTGMKKGERAGLWDAITYKDSVYKALKNKTQRAELAQISVENNIVAKESYAAAPYVGLFEYYGIINRTDGLLDYDNSTKAYLSREQATLMLGRFMHPDGHFGEDLDKHDNDLYKTYSSYYSSASMLGSEHNDGKKVTDGELSSSMTRLEFIHILVYRYFPSDYWEALGDGSSTDASKIFKDIKKSDYGTTKWYKDKGVYGKGENNANRVELANKKLGENSDAIVQAAYKIGILKKDSKGNANLFDKITYSEAVRMLVNSAIGLADGKAN